MENLQNRIKRTRINQGLSQAVLARKTGVSQPTVANWENGSHTPRHAVLLKIGTALGVEPIWLLSGGFAGNEAAAQTYIKRPLQHVPVYNWPQTETELAASPPRNFVPFSTHLTNLTGIVRLIEDESAYEVVIFNPADEPANKVGRYLVMDQRSTKIQPSIDIDNESKVLGRVVARLSYYQ